MLRNLDLKGLLVIFAAFKIISHESVHSLRMAIHGSVTQGSMTAHMISCWSQRRVLRAAEEGRMGQWKPGFVARPQLS